MNKLIALLILVSQIAFGGLPPTTSKDSSDSTNVTSFNFQFPNFTGTHTGTTFSLGINSIAGGGTGANTATVAFDNLAPATDAGGQIVGNGLNAYGNIPIGTTRQQWTVVGGTAAWVDNPLPNPSASPSGLVPVTNGTSYTLAPISAIGISTDWSGAFPITAAGLGSSTYSSLSRRVGDSYQLNAQVTAGTVGGSQSIVLPSGISIDTTKMPSTVAQVGVWTIATSSSGSIFSGVGLSGIIFYDGSTTGSLYFGYNVASHAYSKGNPASNGDVLTLNFTIPVVGWSSNTIGASQGAVYAHYFMSSNQTPGSNTQINFDTKIDDSGCLTGSCLVTTGAGSWKFTASVTGTYQFSGLIGWSATATDVLLYKNGTNVLYTGTGFGSTVPSKNISFSVLASAGDVLDLRTDAAATLVGSAVPYQTYIGIVLQSGNGSGNVSSSSTGSYHTEYARLGFNGASSTVQSSSGSWISFGSYSAPATTWAITSGEFSSTPVCTSVNEYSAMTATASNSYFCPFFSQSNTSLVMTALSATGSEGKTTGFYCDIICMGPR